MNQTTYPPLGRYLLSPAGAYFEYGTPFYNARLRIPLKSFDVFQQYHCRRLSVSSWVKPSFRFSLPLVPQILLQRTLALFRKAAVSPLTGEWRQMEMAVYLHFSNARGWWLTIPQQKASAYRLAPQTISASDDVVVVLHSHGLLSGVFSTTDDHSDDDGFIYGVIGNVHTFTPDMSLRVGFAGHLMSVPVSSVFETGKEFLCHV